MKIATRESEKVAKRIACDYTSIVDDDQYITCVHGDPVLTVFCNKIFMLRYYYLSTQPRKRGET